MSMTAVDPRLGAPRPASVIIVSRHRPGALVRCLTALGQSDHPCFEVIVVADPDGLAAVARSAFGGAVKTAPCDVANVSVARNIGLGLAAAQVVAFIDDDAVAEPTWLSRLIAPFANPDVAAAGGFVRGRNGVSHQWKARSIDSDSVERPLSVDETAVTLHRPAPGRAIKTEGANCAFRRDALAQVGGFDPAYAFYLDDGDVNMRLAAAGMLTAIVPGAEVHHGFAASARRTEGRAPLTLCDIGASTAVFVRRHGGDKARALARLRAEQRRRLLRMMVIGLITPGDVGRLTATLEAGLAEGAARALAPLGPAPLAPTPFQPLPETGPRPHRVITGRAWRRRALAQAAGRSVADGCITTVIRLSTTARPHRVRFCDEGYWEQTGGIFGPTARDGAKFVPGGFSRRIASELSRISATRPQPKAAEICAADAESLRKRV